MPTPQQAGGLPMPQQPQLPPAQPPAALSVATPSAAPKAQEEEADNEDQLDEVWVAKARQIVEQTKDDPYKQSKAISRIKADFLKTRYQKEIKVNEG